MYKKQILGVIFLLTAIVCTTALCNEPNQAQTQIIFENGEKRLPIYYPRLDVAGIPIKPKYVAEVSISNLPRELLFDRRNKQTTIPPRVNIMWQNPTDIDMIEIIARIDFTSQGNIMKIINTPAGEKLSKQQKEFLTTGMGVIKIDPSPNVPNYTLIVISGITEEDARKTTEAFLYFLTQYANEKVDLLKKETALQENEKIRIEGQIAKNDKQYIDAQKQLSKLGKDANYVSAEEAKQTVSEITKVIYSLAIEHAGIEARITENSKFLADNSDQISSETRKNLQEMRIKDLIEFASINSKMKTANDIIKEAQLFYDIKTKMTDLPIERKKFTNRLNNIETAIKALEEKLQNLTPDLMPPRVFQDKVVIYPLDIGRQPE